MASASPILALLAGRRGTWIEIDLDALEGNLRALARVSGGRPIWAVVKADAYGHGAIQCSRALEKAGVSGLVVALAEEGEALRRAGVGVPILIAGVLPIGDLGRLVSHDLIPSLSLASDLARLERAAAAAGRVVPYHLEIDSGMTRLGLDPADLSSFLAAAAAAPHCRLEAVFSHLAAVATPGGSQAQAQNRAFSGAVAEIRQALGRQVPAHLASSPAIHAYPDAFWDMLRPGLLLYGIHPGAGSAPPLPLRPVLSLRTLVMLARAVPAGTRVGYDGTHVTTTPTHIGVLAAGYADGIRRDVAGKGVALVRARPCPYVGAVNMDMAQVDLGPAGLVTPGEVATVIGEDGGEAVRVEDLARTTGRTAYEWLAGLGPRVPRVALRAALPIGIHLPQESGTMPIVPDPPAGGWTSPAPF